MAVRTVNGTPIQAAIDAAQPDDEIRVKAVGGYAGFIAPVGKRLTITADGSPPAIEGPGNTVTVKSAGSTLRGLDIAGASGRNNSCVLVSNVPDVTLDNVETHHGEEGYGVRAYGANAVRLRIIGHRAHHVACAIQFHTGGAGSVVSDPRFTDIDRMIVNDTALNNDTGAMAISFHKTNGLIRVERPSFERIYSVARLGKPASYDYGWDGAAFELFGGCGPVEVEGGEIRGAVWVLETGKNSADPDNKSFTMRGTKVWGFGGGHVDVHTKAAAGLLLRSLLSGRIEGCEFHELDWHVILAEQKSNYVGTVADVAFTGNQVWLKPGDDRLVTLGQGVPASALRLDDNKVYPQGSTAVASVLGKGKTTDRATLTAWTGWEANSYWGPEIFTPVETPLQAAIRERDAALAGLVAANAALAASDATVLSRTSERDAALATVAQAKQNALDTLAL